MADKKIQPTKPTAATAEAKTSVEDKTAERKTATRSRRVSGRKTNNARIF